MDRTERAGAAVLQIRSTRVPMKAVVLAIALSGTILAFVPFHPDLPTVGLDASWRYALNEAVARRLIFGRDLVFTYGPLGFVSARMYHPATYGLMVGFCGFLLSAVFSGCLSLVRGRGAYALLLLPLALVNFVFADGVFLAIPFIFLLAATQWSAKIRLGDAEVVDEGAWGVILVLAAAVALLPLIKGVFTASALVCTTITLFLLARASRERAGFLAGWMLLVMVAVWWALGQPLSALTGFFAGQAPIISGYGDAMSMVGPRSEILVYWAAAAVVAGFFSAQLIARFGRIGLAPAAGLATLLFIAFKAGFVRQDAHVLLAAVCLNLIALLALLMFPGRRSLLGLAASVAAAAYLSLIVTGGSALFLPSEAARYLMDSVKGLVTGLTHPAELGQSYEHALADIRRSPPLPASPATVDIYPTETSVVLANGRKWAPRPVLQSYSAYTPALSALDVNHLTGPSAPERILISVDTIDGRYPAEDDGPSWPVMMSRYSVSGLIGPFLVLARRPTPRDVHPGRRLVVSKAQAFGARVLIPANRTPVWATIDVKPTLLGRVYGALFKQPLLWMQVTYDNGDSRSFRLIPGMGQAGFLLSPTIQDSSDLAGLSVGVDPAYFAGRWPASISLSGDGGARVLWQRHYAIALSALDIAANPNAHAVLFDPQVPVPRLDAAGGDCAIETINGSPVTPGRTLTNARTLGVAGWAAAAANRGRRSDKTFLLLAGQDGGAVMVQTRPTKRTDLAASFQQPNLIDSGFTAWIDSHSLRGRISIRVVQRVDGRFIPCPVSVR